MSRALRRLAARPRPGMVLGLGSSVVDLFHFVRSLPVAGAKGYFRDPRRVTEGTVVGGVTLNHLSWASLLGAPVGLLALQGDDELGRLIRATMVRLGIGMELLRVGPEYPTAVSHIYVADGGERAIMMATGGNSELTAAVFDEFFRDAVPGAALVTAEVCQVPLSAVLRLLEVSGAAGVPSCLDVDVPPSIAAGEAGLGTVQELLRAASGCTVLKPTMESAGELLAAWRTGGRCTDPRAAGIDPALPAERVAGELQRAFGSRLVAVTDGARGCGLALGRPDAAPLELLVAAPRDIEQRDATGAGDAFFGGLVAGLYHSGLPETAAELEVLGQTACALGASCCEVLGALPTEVSPQRVHGLLPVDLRRHVRSAYGEASASATPAATPEPDKARVHIGAGPGAAKMTLAEWSRRKNSGAGPAVSERLPAGWSARSRPPLVAERVPMVPSFMPAVLLRGVLSREECASLIAAVPEGGQGFFGGEEIKQLYHDRVVKYRFLSYDPGLSEVFLSRIREHIPGELDGGRFHRVNPVWRFVHYEEGGHQASHIDGREPVNPELDEAAGWVQSRLTLQVYLSEDFEGGELAFVEPGADGARRTKHVLHPATGDAVLFYQERLQPPTRVPPYELYHEARDVMAGHKYACRTMVDYVFPDSACASLSNLKDDVLRGASSGGA